MHNIRLSEDTKNRQSDIADGLESCHLCPRACGVNRKAGQTGYCRVSSVLKVARAALHMWEEPCISGECGSGAIFFSGCSLGCVFCQNYQISGGQAGKEISRERLQDIFWELKEQGAANINLVTPDHYIPTLVSVLRAVKNQGFDLPIVYNTSAYISVEALRALEGLVDIYLPDYKYDSSDTAELYCRAPDYPQIARSAICEMVRQIKDTADNTGKASSLTCIFDSRGMMKRGVIVRHLLLPGQLLEAKRVVRYLHETYGNDIYISLMNQFTPVKDFEGHVTKKSYQKLVDYAVSLGVEQGFIQEGETVGESYIPPFDLEGV